MTTLHEFLAERLAERAGWRVDLDAATADGDLPVETLRELAADVDAKQRILALHAVEVRTAPARYSEHTGERLAAEHEVTCAVCGWASDDPSSGCETVRLLALPFAGHPDYREEWAL